MLTLNYASCDLGRQFASVYPLLGRYYSSLAPRKRRRKPVPKRPSMLDEVQHLDDNPTISALNVLGRLKLIRPDRFNDQ